MSEVLSKAQLLRAFIEAYEELISTAMEAAQRGVTRQVDRWGPREIVAHLAGWEIMASVRLPKIVAGMAPFEETDETRQAVMNEAINATITTMIGAQSLEAVCSILRHISQRNNELLSQLDDTWFQPGTYVYERTKGVIEHCHEHRQQLLSLRDLS